jgi:Protein of unknown function (DUF2786)
MATTIRTIYSHCEQCGAGFEQPDDPGRKRRFCSAACKQAAYRARKRREQEARRRAEEEAARRAREEARRQRERARTHRPPPHAGSSRPGPFCGACGGHRGPHTTHHDQAAHDRARRRYDGLHAKAASTGFPEEAAACRAKAEQLRAKYGL